MEQDRSAKDGVIAQAFLTLWSSAYVFVTIVDRSAYERIIDTPYGRF
jgi:hypothetical protein